MKKRIRPHNPFARAVKGMATKVVRAKKGKGSYRRKKPRPDETESG